MSGLQAVLMLTGALFCLIVAGAAGIYLLRKFTRPATFTLQKNCIVLFAEGRKPIHFDCLQAAKHFAEKAKEERGIIYNCMEFNNGILFELDWEEK